MARYTRDSEFWHDFADGMTAKIPWSKTTSTYRRAMKREQRKLEDSHMGLGLEASRRVREMERRENNEVDAIFREIVGRVQKEHPELSRIKAMRYARTKDLVGRKYDRLFNQGLGAQTIRDKLHLGKKGSKPSTGKMGH